MRTPVAAELIQLIIKRTVWPSALRAPCESAEQVSRAQVYMLAVVAQLQRGAEPKIGQDLTILVPPYDPAHIFRPSHEPEASETDLELET